MSSAGRSGTSDTDRTNLQGEQGNLTGTPTDMSSAPSASGPLMPGETAPDQIEMVEIIAVDDDIDDTLDMGSPGFRWWYVPALGLPVAVGTGAAIWYLTKGAEPYQNAWELVTRPTRGLTGQPRLAATTRKAAKKASATSETLRDRVTDALSGFDAAELAEKASDLWDDARDSMVDLWDQLTDHDTLGQARDTAGNVRDATQRQIGKMAGNIAAAGTALALQKKASDLADTARAKAKAARDTAQGTARRVTNKNAVSSGTATRSLGKIGMMGGAWLAKNRARAKVNDLSGTASDLKNRAKRQFAKQGASAASKATLKAVQVKGARAAKKTRKRVTSPFRRMGTFALAALTTALVIYVRSWYSRRSGAGAMRETAGGRMEPDTWPRFAGRAPDTAATTAMNSPTEPS